MADYDVHLHDGVGVEPVTETVTASDQVEMRALAEMRLLLSSDFTHVEVFLDGVEQFRLVRDSQA